MNSYFKACLINWNTINVMVFADFIKAENYEFFLYKNNSSIEKLSIIKKTSQQNVRIFDLKCSSPIELGNEYYISISDFPLQVLDVNHAVVFPDFDEKYYYDKDDLGSSYSREETTFKVFAPLASEVVLKIENNDEFSFVKMNRDSNGVYSISLKGDYLNRKYHYLITNSGVRRETNDPYAKGTSLNSEYSVVIDLNELNKIDFVKPKNKINNYVDSIIYELNVRDFSEDKHTNIENKGKYLGLIEENRKTNGGNPAGLDYLKYIGITHVQLQPIHDFRGVDDIDVHKSYNWGYDPISYFALEGSYSSNPNDAISRLLEFKKMVAVLHENNIRVNVDVVFNHTFDYLNSVYEKCVPNYYFRRKPNGQIANASGCGNDIRSEKKMVRKLIIDSVTYLIKTFDIDGIRFDLMGLIDVDTINECYKAAKSIKEDVMFYGEGWDMGYELPKAKKSCLENYKALPNIAFFNDTFRNVMIGSAFIASEKGFVGGDSSYKYGVDYVFFGSCLKHSYDPKFDNANRSINYVECHDNYTLFDKLSLANPDEDEETILKRVKLANKLVMLSFGVPFIHMGQEIGLSKQNLGNTYNIPRINNLDYDLVDKRFEYVSYLRMLTDLRRKLSYLSISDPKEIEKVFKVDFWDNKVICFESKDDKLTAPYKGLLILINDENEKKSFVFDDYYTFLQGGKDTLNESIVIKNNFVPNCSIGVFYKKD